MSERIEDLPKNLYVVMLWTLAGKAFPVDVFLNSESAIDCANHRNVKEPKRHFVIPYHHFSACSTPTKEVLWGHRNPSSKQEPITFASLAAVVRTLERLKPLNSWTDEQLVEVVKGLVS